MDQMINVLTRGIGPELWKPIRIDYYNKKRLLEKERKYQQSPDEIKQFLVDVMALSIFNQLVIIPYQGSMNFYTGTHKYGVNKVRMGNYHIDSDFQRQALSITKQFYAITKEYGLQDRALHISSVNSFTDTWLEVAESYG